MNALRRAGGARHRGFDTAALGLIYVGEADSKVLFPAFRDRDFPHLRSGIQLQNAGVPWRKVFHMGRLVLLGADRVVCPICQKGLHKPRLPGFVRQRQRTAPSGKALSTFAPPSSNA